LRPAEASHRRSPPLTGFGQRLGRHQPRRAGTDDHHAGVHAGTVSGRRWHWRRLVEVASRGESSARINPAGRRAAAADIWPLLERVGGVPLQHAVFQQHLHATQRLRWL